MIPKVGDLFRQFHILEKAGEGGMGEVYRALDTKLDREVALKFLTRVGRLVPEHSDRLRQEAKSLAALSHANIVTIYDIGEAEGVPFLVLEWVPGKSLNDPSLTRPWSVERFLQVALPVAEALAAAHERGIVHRDVKPGNVLVTDDGRVKLVDFGLAKVLESDLNLTRTATALGTVAYMSPEQVSAAEVGPPSDVFSFGVMAYELLTGQLPFGGQNAAAVLYQIIHATQNPLSEWRTDLPKCLDVLIEQCLEKDSNARFPSGKELVQELNLIMRKAISGDVTELSPPRVQMRPAIRAQEIRFCTSTDGARVAYSMVGRGPLIVRVLGWFTHLEMEWEWPDLRLFWEGLAEEHTVVRYDGRGIGLSDPYMGDFTEETRLLDLEAVLNAVSAEKVILLGISEGGWTAASYAIRHPARVSHLILYGAYSRGRIARPNFDPEEERALMTLIRKGWGQDTPRFRQIFTSQFFRSNAEPGLIAHFNDMQRASADPETAARYVESCHSRGDGRELFMQVGTPTLVIHCRDDQNVSFEEGRILAALIPGAQLLPLPSGTHYFPTDRKIVSKVVEGILRFVGETPKD